MNADIGHHRRDYYGGALIVLLGALVTYQASRYNIGTLSRMGPGLYPVMLGVALMITGASIAFTASADGENEKAAGRQPQWRGWLCITSGIVAFVIAGTYAGLLPATLLLVFISALGDRKNTLKSAIILSLIMAVVSVTVFWWALSLQLPLFTWPK
jgi:Tripartite tricarboxylate transporter TctB family